MEQKKNYEAPKVETIEIRSEGALLMGSGDNWAREYQSGLEDED